MRYLPAVLAVGEPLLEIFPNHRNHVLHRQGDGRDRLRRAVHGVDRLAVLIRLVLAKLVDRISQLGVLGHAATCDNRPEGLRLPRRRLGIEIREVERDIEDIRKRLPYGGMRRTGICFA